MDQKMPSILFCSMFRPRKQVDAEDKNEQRGNGKGLLDDVFDVGQPFVGEEIDQAQGQEGQKEQLR